MITAKELGIRVKMRAQLRLKSALIDVTINDVREVDGHTECLVAPITGSSEESWVPASRLERISITDGEELAPVI